MPVALLDWPITLPQCPTKDYAEDFGLNIIRTPVDAGPAKMRRRAARPSLLKVTYDLSSAQVEILKDFVQNQIFGVYRFKYPHPRTNTVVEARIVPSSDGKLYDIRYFGHDTWTVSLDIEVLP